MYHHILRHLRSRLTPRIGLSPIQRTFTNNAQLTTLPESADIVIVGGGAAGCSLLYHLTRLGANNVVLLEKDDITAGSTWHAAGIVWNFRGSEIETELLSRTWRLMGQLEEEEGVSINRDANGSITIVDCPDRLQEFYRYEMVSRWMEVEAQKLSPREIKEMHPFVNLDHVYAGFYLPSDGGVDQSSYCHALVKGATRRGAKVATGTQVTAVETHVNDLGQKHVTGVVTDRGRIATNCIVNCCGAWAPELGKMAGVKVPLTAMQHAYVISEPIDGFRSLPLLRHNGFRLYIRPQGGTVLFGGYEWNPQFGAVEPDFAFSLYDMNWNSFSSILEGAMQLLPVLENTGIKNTICGPESFTPDHKSLLGESSEVHGFWLDCGFNSQGIMMSGGVGSEMAKWLVNGKPDLDLFNLNVRRFSDQESQNTQWIKERSHEAYTKNFSIRYPHDEAVAGRNFIRDALFEELLRRGAFYHSRHGIERPSWFDTNNQGVTPLPYILDDDQARADQELTDPYMIRLNTELTFDVPAHHWTSIGLECFGCRRNIAVFNQSSFGKLYLSGPDAQAAVDWIFSARMDRGIGRTAYTCALNEFGGIETDLTVSAVPARGSGLAHSPNLEETDGVAFYINTGSGTKQYVVSHIRDQLFKKQFRCSLVDKTHDLVLLSVQGPYSRALLESLTTADLSNEAFPFSTHKEINVAGHPCRALRLTFVGELGWELHVPSSSAVSVYRALMHEGAKFGVVDAGFRALDSLSLEKGYMHWQGEIRTDDTPLEAGLGFTCKLKSGQDFLGRPALLKQKEHGIPKKLLLFTLDRQGKDKVPIILHGHELVYRDGEMVGYLRRGGFAYTLDKSLGYGYVRTGMSDILEGDWEIEVMGQKYSVSAHLKSMFDPKGLRIKGIYDDMNETEAVMIG